MLISQKFNVFAYKFSMCNNIETVPWLRCFTLPSSMLMLRVFLFLWHIIYYLLFKASWFHYYLLDVLLFSFLMKTSEKVRKKLKIVLDIKKLHLTYLEGVSIEREGLIKVVWYNFNFLCLCYFSSFFYSYNLYC